MRTLFPGPALTLAHWTNAHSAGAAEPAVQQVLVGDELKDLRTHQKWLFASSFVVFVTPFVVAGASLVVPGTLLVVAVSWLDVAAENWRDQGPDTASPSGEAVAPRGKKGRGDCLRTLGASCPPRSIRRAPSSRFPCLSGWKSTSSSPPPARCSPPPATASAQSRTPRSTRRSWACPARCR